ncbi:hypothetical protein KEM54_000056, partial [Ascosphaera aggregata]
MDSQGDSRSRNDAQQSIGEKRPSSSNGNDFATSQQPYRPRWTLGMLNDKETDEVPGKSPPLGLNNLPNRTSSSSLPQSVNSQSQRLAESTPTPTVKRTPDGTIVLTPQPEESLNDPLNWPVWRRDAALLSLGFYCMLGGGTTPILAAGYDDVATQYDVSTQRVALTT